MFHSKQKQTAEVLPYAMTVTPQAWEQAVSCHKHRRHSTFEGRLHELFVTAARAYNQSCEAPQVHFSLCAFLRKKQPRLELTLSLMAPIQGKPYLLLSLRDELVES
ncbi:hypothetical protein [Pseudomonas gingeri]|uniref:Uncharacterized protein n=1 Tax=Pseudomonas gingeri TaxID=117681 RepID=A0A7Y7YCW4_9PSED|nr:hypothetical protein [Pseudomonas gingeri]NWB28451.1 hypothetical protein [Pseudomonas gingeri]NWC34151.1 hypothetical protein [Pseudomonas gingeri]